MRKILFRGKLIHSKVWIYGNLIIASTGESYIIPSDVIKPDGHHLIIDSDCPFLVDAETVGQFTGLTDKNGKEIYEGDVVRKMKEDWVIMDDWDESDPRWDDPKCYPLIVDNIDYVSLDRFRFWLKNESFGYEGEDLQYPEDYEIIGNIHDNPELNKKNRL